MLKKILVGVGILFVLLIVAFFYLNHRNRTLSPPGEVSARYQNLEITISYSRPSVRERKIFGEEEEGALLPYGKYWRLGANEPTVITASSAFMVGNTQLEPGKYTLYAVPQKGSMQLMLNAEVEIWGTMIPASENDVAQYAASMETHPNTEQFTIELIEVENGIDALFKWDGYRWTLPIRTK
jgi:hypothetical protein